MRRLLVAALAALLVVGALSSCAPIVRQSDNGDWAYARQLFPILYGRKARGHEELKVIVDMIALVGRDATVRGMMDLPEFADHWTELLLNHMRASKESAGADSQSQQSCFPAALQPAGQAPELARWIRDHAPDAGAAQCGGSPCGSFMMSDVLRSAVLLDDLSPAYRAYLFAMQNRPISGNQVSESNQRSSIYKRFESVFLHRRNECLACHNSAASVTGPSSFWNRSHPVPVFLEQSVFGADSGRVDEAELRAPFRVSGVNGGGTSPWGLGSCGSFARPATDDTELTGAQIGFMTKAFGKRGSVFDIEGELHRGVDGLRDGLGRCSGPIVPAPTAACTACTSFTEPALSAAQIAARDAVRAAFESPNGQPGDSCFGCHGIAPNGMGQLRMTATDFAQKLVRVASTTTPPAVRVLPGCADGSEAGCGGQGSALIERITTTNASRHMPPGGTLSAAQITTVRNWIRGLPTGAGCSSCMPSGLACGDILNHHFVAGHEGFAYMTAASVVDAVWTEVMGYPLTIDNYFPRNEGQKSLLWNLTEYHFVDEHWSLKELLTTVLSYRYFNRKPPVAGDGPSAYELPQFFNPWAEGDPRVPPIAQPGWATGSTTPPVAAPGYDPNLEANRPRHYDPMTDAVHRHGTRSLLRSAGLALGWGSPQRYPGSAYPTRELSLAMGEYLNDVQPGFRGTNFSSLLNWESVHGRCARPSSLATDWVDRLLGAVTPFDTANPSAPAQVEDVARAVKDWLVNYSDFDGTTPVGLSSGERAFIAGLYGVPDLTARASTLPDLADKTRRYCGVLLQSPQFMLAGLEPPAGSAPPARPRLRACNDATCSYLDVCAGYASAVGRHAGMRLMCLSDGVTPAPDIRDRWDHERWLKPIELICALTPCEIVPRPRGCELGQACKLPPRCDPRIDGCGGPLPPIELAKQLGTDKVLTMRLSDPRVAALLAGPDAELLRDGRAMPRGTPPAAGDWIRFKPGARVQLGERSQVLGAAGKPALRDDAQGDKRDDALYVAIVAPRDPISARVSVPRVAPSLDEIRSIQNNPARRHGSAGAPLDANDLRFDPRQLEERMRGERR
ncbi:MAG TPA: hypothetical protein VF169_14895 [Albitalea sp.]|uniref:hypothetical protein n=1 Tax=Piscinibacter sp. TaxID=1903157 RepID=UPI002ED1AACE